MSERPLLIMRTGIRRSAPAGFYEAIAEKYEANSLSSKNVRDHYRKKFGNSILGEVVRRTLTIQAVDHLSDGENVFYEGYLNRIADRRYVRETATRQSLLGACVVLLSVTAPMEIIEQRTIDDHRSAEGTVSNRAQLRIENDMRTAREMRTNIQLPTFEEHLRLDGNKDVSQLLQETDAYINELRGTNS